MSMNLRMATVASLEWSADKVRFIDQTKLPHREEVVETKDYRRVAEAIRRLEIRGAPAIGTAAAFAVVLAATEHHGDGTAEILSHVQEAIDTLSGTRPTAVNLFASMERMKRACERVRDRDDAAIRLALLHEAMEIQREDADSSRRIGEFGAALIEQGSTVLTHCNTGGLAAGGEGTANSVILEAHKRGKVQCVYIDETRPLLQGARLTAWEMKRNKINAVLITDSTAGFLMQLGRIDVVIVGADRIAANGDVANKIGTYSLAVLAQRHRIPFYVAAPLSTFDMDTPSGDAIPIEERDPSEITHIGGTRIAPEGVEAFAPAFDRTPHELVTALITDEGIINNPDTLKVGVFLKKKTSQVPAGL